jgi:hypothetical protein
MNSLAKFLIYSLVIVLLFNIKANSKINYGNYLKNYYNIPSYYSIENDCLKNSFYENIIRQNHVTNKKYETYIPYKTKLDNIVIYF